MQILDGIKKVSTLYFIDYQSIKLNTIQLKRKKTYVLLLFQRRFNSIL